MRGTLSRSFRSTLRQWIAFTDKQVPTRRSHFFQEKDRVMLRHVNDRANTFFLGPLRSSDETEFFGGRMKHDTVIGSKRGSIVKSSRGGLFYADEPSMAEHILFKQPRLATPIYPADARFIVSLLDLHVGHLEELADGKMEILECGSGHGSLTLHLAHAMHRANGPPPKIDGLELDNWLSNRKAVIWSVESNPKRSLLAKQTVESFRDGEYGPSVTFQTARLQDFLADQIATRGHLDIFSYILLDLPYDEADLKACANTLLLNGMLVLYCPNISQIENAVLSIEQWGGSTMRLEDVVELGTNISGGRRWDVSRVRIREPQPEPVSEPKGFDPLARIPDLQPQVNNSQADSASTFERGTPAEQASGEELPSVTSTIEESFAKASPARLGVRARPRVGLRIVGGAFVAIFRKRTSFDREPRTTNPDLD